MDTTIDVMTLKVSELKAQLTAKGLEATGVKSTLQARLKQALASEAAPSQEKAAEEEPQEVVDESTRYSGTVFKFIKRRGFGRIIPEGKTEADKDDMVFVHWKQIQSSDPWPALEEGQEVEYYLGKRTNPKDPKKAVFAASVTLKGGQQVSCTDTRVFPNRGERFSGICTFFNKFKGFGFIKPKEDFNFDETDFKAGEKAKIYIAREDIKTSDDVDSMPSIKNDAEVEFTLYKTAQKDGSFKYAAGDVTMPGGVPLTEDDFKPKPTPEERKAARAAAKQRGTKRKRNQKGKGKKGQKGKKGKQGAFQMGGMTFIPMNQQRQQPQIVMMNGQPYMVMPQQMGGMMGGMQMAGMQMMGGFQQPKKKKRRKNKNNKGGKKKGGNGMNMGGNW